MRTNTPCSWYGVTWSDGDVFQINLGGNQLNGSIPPELGNLTNLGTLVLGVNQLSGSISPELGNLVDLQELRLSFNQLSDPLPASLINLDELQQFYFNNTNLCEPQNTAFQSWLADIPDVQGTGVACMTSAGGTVTSPDEIALVFFPPETNSEEIFIYLTITLIEDTSVIPATGGFQL